MEAQNFADQFKDVFTSAHWIEEPSIFLISGREAVGLWILVPKDAEQPEGATHLYQALTQAGFTVNGVEAPGMKVPHYELMVGLESTK